MFVNCTPDEFQRHATAVLSAERSGPLKDFYFLKSWNEWAEGNYLEPDRQHGRAWIDAMRKALDEAATFRVHRVHSDPTALRVPADCSDSR